MSNKVSKSFKVILSISVLSLLIPAASIPSAFAPPPVCTAPPPNMISWWPGDGNAQDIQDNNDGTLQNGATFVAGKVGQAFSLDGIDDFVEVPDADNLDMTGDFTIDVWVSLDTGKTEQNIVSKESASVTTNYNVHILNNKVFLAVSFPGSPQPSPSSNPTGFASKGQFGSFLFGATSFVDESNPFGTLRHIAAVYDDSTKTMKVYLDGQLDGEATFNTASSPVTNVETLQIGKRKVFTNNNLDGIIDELEIFNSALSASEIQTIFNAGSAGKCKEAPNTPPVCSAASPSTDSLWPPNHKFVDITVNDVTDPDDGDTVTITVTGITQDEAVDAKGSGKTAPDGETDGDSAKIRAERSGKGDGRVYEISFTADDGNGGMCSGSVSVGVPHDKKGTAVDSGQDFDSTIIP